MAASTNGTGPADDQSAELERLGVGGGFMDVADPVSLSVSLARALARQAADPVGLATTLGAHGGRMAKATVASVARAWGFQVEGPARPEPKDARWKEAAWQENAAFYGLMQAYLLNSQLMLELVEGAPVDPAVRSKARFAAKLIADSASPTNFLFTNPKALRRAAETGGWSLIRGLRNMTRDILHNNGWPSQVDTSPFELGRNMAASKGQVVFRNDLIELIQYQPATDKVHEIPLLMGPPWINKYYILDIGPGKSLVEWAVNHGLSTFAISYRNPDASMRDYGFDDYMLKGPRTALDVVREITGSETVNNLSVCLGGTLNTCLMAYLNATGDGDLIHSSTSLNSLVDHRRAGILSEVFTDPATVGGLERRMAKQGYLEAADMARTFDLLRANDLVFQYVSSGWLCGEQPPAFDLLAWNHDSTRMPAKMHSFYLRTCWIDNQLAENRMELAGERLDVSALDVDSYIVAAKDDHIVPWRNSYRTTQLLKADCRFVLSSGGHIAGIVNPPSPKARLWTNDNLPPDADAWLEGATLEQKTWWDDWVDWILPRSGEKRNPPPMGSAAHPPLEPAPGTYVRG
jgi:polyhydroxyalkanoate synthase